jgi:acyl phosphate:glycerol-3-phosphate acyltransferase
MNLEGIEPQQIFQVRFFWFKIGGLITLIGYLLGSIPFGLIIAKAHGVDIRKHGSGNIGATNVMRTLGKKAGYMAFGLDALKGLLAVVAGKLIAQHFSITISQSQTAYHGIDHAIYHSTYFIKFPVAIAAILGAIACIIGHNFPVWLGFKGGKGMATSAGVLIGMMPITAASCMAIWAIVFLTTRYVSLASIAAAIALPLSTMVFLMTGIIQGWPYFYFAAAAGILAIWRHRSNIVRILNGTELRFEKKPKLAEAPPAQ